MSEPPTKEKTSLEDSSPVLPDPSGHIYDEENVHRATVLQDGSVHLLQGRFRIRHRHVQMLPPLNEDQKKE